MDKVYCKTCCYHNHNVYNKSTPHHCSKNIDVQEISPIEVTEYKTDDCLVINKNNDCTHYKRNYVY